jgi:hypothetical protein
MSPIMAMKIVLISVNTVRLMMRKHTPVNVSPIDVASMNMNLVVHVVLMSVKGK